MSTIKTRIIAEDLTVDNRLEPNNWQERMNERIADIDSSKIHGIFPLDSGINLGDTTSSRIGFVIFYSE